MYKQGKVYQGFKTRTLTTLCRLLLLSLILLFQQPNQLLTGRPLRHFVPHWLIAVLVLSSISLPRTIQGIYHE